MALDSSINSSITEYVESMSMDVETTLKSIDLTLKAIARSDGMLISQASLQDMSQQLSSDTAASRARARAATKDQQGKSKANAYDRGDFKFDTNDIRRRGKISAGKFFDEVTDSLEDAFKDALFGSAHPFQDALKEPLAGFAKSIGSNMQDLSKDLGKKLGQQIGNAFKDNPIGQQLQREWQGIGNFLASKGINYMGKASSFLNDPQSLSRMINGKNAGSGINQHPEEDQQQSRSSNLADKGMDYAKDLLKKSGKGEGEFTGEASKLAEESIDDVAKAASDAEGSLSGITQAAGESAEGLAQLPATTAGATGEVAALGTEAAAAGEGAAAAAVAFPEVTLALVAAAIALEAFSEAVGPAIEGIKSMWEATKNAGTRIQSQNSKNLELYRNRIKQDIESMATAPFEIMKDAANSALQTWDAVLQTVTATQGYDKAGLQDLWSSYADRLESEGLSSVISSADMMSNLESVLKSGLSGSVAEEFAYMATVLNNAIPTQDFFQYASTYASIAANAIKNGASQEDAIQAANDELESFASNLLYASRQIAGGFSTSLQNSASLFEDAAKIAVASRTGELSEISGVLTSVSALVGSIAPDLANGVVDAVVQAATGGNSTTLTALRSMTSAGASNTAFLKALSEDPQKVFTELFTNLANMQSMSSDNYMEVAEALSSVFGMSMDTFARVDFQYLADAISAMNVNNKSLQENMEMLSSGQTTLTSAQMRMQKINEYMLDEGLSYVLDNEVARSVQEHMWSEQLNRELMENTFAVDIQGAALEFLQGICETIQNILNFLDPGSWIRSVSSVALTAIEAATLNDDLAKIIDQGKVGGGNETSYTNLISGNKDLKLVDSYLGLMGLTTTAAGSAVSNILDFMQHANASTLVMESGVFTPSTTASGSVGKQSALYGASNAANRYYKWGTITKSASSVASSGDWRTSEGYSPIWTAQEQLAQVSQQKVQDFLDSMENYAADMAAATASGSSSSKAIAKAREAAEHLFLTQEELEDLVLNADIEEPEMSFDKWLGSATGYGISNLGQVLSDYGLTMTDVQTKFQQYQTQASSKAEHARQLHEVQFWENVEAYNNDYFPNHFENEFLRTEWMLNWEMLYMTPIRDDLHQLLTDWEDYYIHHTAYTDATKSAFEDAIDLANKEKDETGDSVLALAKALTENSNWLQENQELLKDPVVHANVLLSQILVVTEAIMQQNNGTSTNAIPTSLLSMGTGGNY